MITDFTPRKRRLLVLIPADEKYDLLVFHGSNLLAEMSAFHPLRTGGIRPIADNRRSRDAALQLATGSDSVGVENVDVIDGMGLRKDGSCVEMLIADHLEWGDRDHLSLFAAKVEAYANAFLSGQVTENLPAAKGKRAVIRVVWKYEPDLEAARLFGLVQQQLADAGIGFEAGPLPEGY